MNNRALFRFITFESSKRFFSLLFLVPANFKFPRRGSKKSSTPLRGDERIIWVPMEPIIIGPELVRINAKKVNGGPRFKPWTQLFVEGTCSAKWEILPALAMKFSRK